MTSAGCSSAGFRWCLFLTYSSHFRSWSANYLHFVVWISQTYTRSARPGPGWRPSYKYQFASASCLWMLLCLSMRLCRFSGWYSSHRGHSSRIVETWGFQTLDFEAAGPWKPIDRLGFSQSQRYRWVLSQASSDLPRLEFTLGRAAMFQSQELNW